MWDLALKWPRGYITWRQFLAFVATTLVAIFGTLIFSSHPVHAADANWRNENTITYESNEYTGPVAAIEGDSHNLPEGSQIFTFISEPTPSGDQTAHIIYFEPDTDINTAERAHYVEFDFRPRDNYSDPSNRQTIEIEQLATSTATNNPGTTSCALEGFGWIVCPMTNFISNATDWLFSILTGFLTVRPLEMSQDTALFRAWSYMRGFANLAFVLSFLIIIYSQLTSIGLKNYDIKRLLPRLIIAAILVNISFYISAALVDVSNILGHSLQGVFIDIRNSLVGTEGNNWDIGWGWQDVTRYALSAGGIGALAFVGYASSGVVGLVYLLLPILVGVGFAILVALVVLAARQAIITVLIVISPLAFVAFLLPNTEKLFNKWRDLLSTMLMLFPIFSVLFGGSQLAGALIIQNAGSMHMLIFGMFVQIVPVVVTPLLIRFSGRLVGQIAQMAAKPGRKLVDAEKSHAQRKLELHKAKRRQEGSTARRHQIGKRRAYRSFMNAERDKALTEMFNTRSESDWTNSDAYSNIQQRIRAARDTKETGELKAEAAYEASKLVSSAAEDIDISLRVAKAEVDLSKTRVDANWEELKAGDARHYTAGGVAASALANTIKNDALQKQVEVRRTHSAQHEQQQQFAETLIQNQAKAVEAGGIASHGADSALAAAISTTRKAYGDSVAEARQIIKHFNLSGAERQAHAMGQTVNVSDSHGNTRTLDSSSIFTREAAIEEQMATGTVNDALQIVQASGRPDMAQFATTISDGVAKNGWGAKTAGFLGGRLIDEIAQGRVSSEHHVDQFIIEMIAKGKVSADKLATSDVDAVKRILEVVTKLKAGQLAPIGLNGTDFSSGDENITDGLNSLRDNANLALTEPTMYTRASENTRKQLREIQMEI